MDSGITSVLSSEITPGGIQGSIWSCQGLTQVGHMWGILILPTALLLQPIEKTLLTRIGKILGWWVYPYVKRVVTQFYGDWISPLTRHMYTFVIWLLCDFYNRLIIGSKYFSGYFLANQSNSKKKKGAVKCKKKELGNWQLNYVVL